MVNSPTLTVSYVIHFNHQGAFAMVLFRQHGFLHDGWADDVLGMQSYKAPNRVRSQTFVRMVTLPDHAQRASVTTFLSGFLKS